MALQYDLAPYSGKTSLISFRATRRELKFARARTFQPPQARPPRPAPPLLNAPGDMALDLEDLWRAIEAVPAPAALAAPPTFQSTRAGPSPAGVALKLA